MHASFSERMGFKKVRTEIQIKSMDIALRKRLWNVLDLYYWTKGEGEKRYGYVASKMQSFLNKLMHHHYKDTVDILPKKWSDARALLKARFFECEWFAVYDFIEFTADNYPDKTTNEQFMKTCKSVLEEEMSAYRFVGGRITPITSEEEISEIDEALETPLRPVRVHVEEALKLLSDRKSPNYRNSIKESISAVEAICRLIANDKNAKLGQALNKIENKIGLHGALKKAFSCLYGYTSSANGIRHALFDEPSTLSFEDAKFMLVSCSAFINYLVAKMGKAGIEP